MIVYSYAIGSRCVVCCGISAFGHVLNAHQLETQSAYAVEDALELGIINNLPREDRAPAFRFHVHPFEGLSVSLAKLSAHLNPVDRSCAHGNPLFASVLRNVHRKRRARQGDLSSPNWRFPLGDFWALGEG